MANKKAKKEARSNGRERGRQGNLAARRPPRETGQRRAIEARQPNTGRDGDGQKQGRAGRAGASQTSAGQAEASQAGSGRAEAVAVPEAHFPIVGIGASAGGLEAVKELLEEMSPDTGVAIILVQHLSPNHESMLAELLGGSTAMPVMQVSEGMSIKPDHVYVIPPNAHMGISNQGKFHLTPRPLDRSQHTPVDSFFTSLAQYAEGRAIGIVLSGTASDGAAGLREIKAAGGTTIAQLPETAKYDGMPRAAISTGKVDMILSPKQIAVELARLGRHPSMRHLHAKLPGEDLEVTEDHLRTIFGILRRATGVDFTHYKHPTIRRRLQRRLILHKIVSTQQYIKFLEQNIQEAQALHADILIHVTRFFREPDSFVTLSEMVFPRMIIRRQAEGEQASPIRIWVPGCATGEEAYSVAMALLEFLGDDVVRTPVQLFATDISEPAVEHARLGVYPSSITEDVSTERLRRFFTPSESGYRISKQVRDLCIFARQDLTRDPPFSKLDLIVCRNVLIYLSTMLQKRLMEVFHYALRPSGHLLLGSAETVGASADLFSAVDRHRRLYQRKDSYLSPRTSGLGLQQGAYTGLEPAAKANLASRTINTVHSVANRLLLDRFSPPAVVVDAELKIEQFRGHTGPFLEPAPGEAALSILKMAREGLLYALRSALDEAGRSGQTVRKKGLRVRHNKDFKDVDLEVMPIDGPSGERHFLVVFEDKGTLDEEAITPSKAPTRGTKKGKKASRGLLSRLRQELAASREYSESIIQDLEAANEELQSANEEILSSNEELQSTNEELDTAKEELQSSNEELNTLNEELHGRNQELSMANSDLVNLLVSVQIAIVMVGADLRIRRLTPMAEKVLNLIPADIGRPIGNIKPNINCPDLEKLIHEAINSMVAIERDVIDQDENPYSLRIRPYKNAEARIDGAVLALFDSAPAHKAADLIREGGELVQALLDTIAQPMVALDQSLNVVYQNPPFSERFGRSREHGQSIYEVLEGMVDKARLKSLLEQVLPRDGRAERYELGGSDGNTLLATARQVMRANMLPASILLAVDQ